MIDQRLRQPILLSAACLRVLLVLLVLWQGAQLVFRDDLRDALRGGDALFAAGRYHAARAAYRDLAARWPQAAIAHSRLGMVEAVRGDYAAADRQLSYALGQGLVGGERDLARLYQGWAAAVQGRRDDAGRFWGAVGQGRPLFALRRALEGESLLRGGDYAAAEAAYRAALLPDLPGDWRALTHRRLAALRASSDADAALAELRASAERLPTAAPHAQAALLGPLLPDGGPDPQLLAAVLTGDPALRPQLLGQLYLDSGLYGLAEAQFSAVAPDSPNALAAATYAAYTRWLAVDSASGIAQLERIVASHPAEPRPRALLALTYLAGQDERRAHAQLSTIQAMAPRAPDTHLAWGQWYAALHNYEAAAQSYRRALDEAAPEQRGAYSLALAQFHIDSDLQVCQVGQPAAENATALLPASAAAWKALAVARLRCDDAAGARQAAQAALDHAPADAEAAYHLGRALAQLGDRAGARLALVRAADLAPASPWRARAEAQLQTMGLM